jgi:hypothetical protein
LQTCHFENLAVGMRETLRKTVENEDVIGFAELSRRARLRCECSVEAGWRSTAKARSAFPRPPHAPARLDPRAASRQFLRRDSASSSRGHAGFR